MDDTEALLSIGAFARRVGLAPSALRFYDDCGVLRPAHVDDTTGYRYYRPGQETRAVRVRRLREAGLPLVEAAVVLDAPPEEARAVLERHARHTRETARAAQRVIEEVLRGLPGEAGSAVARVGGAELAGAVRQVAPAVARGAVADRFPALGRVLIELDGQEIRLVATDRYRLAVRVLRPGTHGGPPRSVLADAAALRDVAAWALTRPEVRLESDGREARVHGDGETRTLPSLDAEYPSYRMVLDGLPAPVHRLITGREALRDVVAGATGTGRPLALRADDTGLTVLCPGTDGVLLPAIRTGPPLGITFDPDVLLPALDAGVGPDVLLEISGDGLPVTVRSADQGSFTTLVMPVRNPAGRTTP
ncbi:MerR family transcriptional regulator [Streptomyces sp. SP18CS02]|uniref:MerR family transcriptional regulator n=1 Tax=Streptomyces sp. SP18CS02 TaxID=3002531 RepID=UPI002E79CEAF|nr:MerR family transcriptional regulator [Streptomyces sp. SP18CS02]MEE1756522.1 MerR family transcriptional regulator [Streptomyces sp. SP18CS02]